MVTAYIRSLYERSYGASALPAASSNGQNLSNGQSNNGAVSDGRRTTDEIEDCYFCRVSGFLVFGGTGLYCWDLARKARPATADRRVYGGIGAMFVALAIFRAATPAGWRERRAQALEDANSAKS